MTKLTTIGLYNFDKSLFDNMVLPDGIDRDEAINNILLECGELPVLYASFDFMKFSIGVWSKKWHDAFARIFLALTEEYNPIHNFDRYEDYEDSEKTSRNGSSNITGESSTDVTNDSHTDEKNEQKTSAFNESDYSPQSLNTVTRDVDEDNFISSTTSSRGTSKDDGTRELKHKAHLYGNIGVTESTKMIENEINLRENANIYGIIADVYKNEMCLYIY